MKLSRAFHAFPWRGVVGLCLATATVASAANYSFTKIADDADGTLNTFRPAGGVNAAGTVVFSALGTNDTAGIYTGSGGAVTTVAQASHFDLGYDWGAVINNAGGIAYLQHNGYGTNGNPNSVVYNAGGGPVVVASGTGSPYINVNPPALNNGGTVAFGASAATSFSLFTHTAGTTTERYHSDANSIYFYGLSTFVHLNDSGTLAFNGTIGPGAQQVNGIFKGPGGSFTTIAVENDSTNQFIALSPAPALNNAGVVVFQATKLSGFTTTTGIYSGNGGPLTTYADTAGPYSTIYNPAISDGVVVAFRADTDTFINDGPNGIFTGTNPLTDHVVRIGDQLFPGLYVTDLFYDGAINEHGQIAFRYTVQSFDHTITRSGVALATPDTSAPVLSNILQVNVGGGPTTIGGMQATFDAVTQDGRFSADFFRPDTTADLALRIGDDAAGAVDFSLASLDYQVWQLEFSGVFTGNADLVFHYDDTNLLVDESALQIRHFVNGQWEIPGQTLDTVNNTITLAANSFSPFVLSAVPEPGTGSLLAAGGLALLRLRNRRKHQRDMPA
ncbi:MAG: PEP-CTERM sorting domain-containing protein [Verrucomicrobia bacterium]|nr:PEP-CTERM sorting domain-containing protein [Verrucomicrobiota bacterium]